MYQPIELLVLGIVALVCSGVSFWLLIKVLDGLGVIHALVNSNMTEAKQAEYRATMSSLALMKEMIELKKKSGDEPTPETIEAVKVVEAKAIELRTVLAERMEVQNSIDATA